MSRKIGTEQRQIGFVIATSFLILLVPSLAARLTGWRWRPWLPGQEGYGSVTGEAWKMASNVAQHSRAGL